MTELVDKLLNHGESLLPVVLVRLPVRWLGVLLSECGSLTLDEVQLATACLQSLPAGEADAVREALRALVKRKHRLRGQ